MDVFRPAAAALWTAVVSFASVFIIRNRAMAVVAAVCASVVIPAALGILFTSFYPLSPLGPEDLLEKAFHIFIGTEAQHLLSTLSGMAAGITLGAFAAYFVMRRRG